ncbi:MAG: hypothetical protein BWK80_19960, partial [Desulfobacteraceae bacterium IS3]
MQPFLTELNAFSFVISFAASMFAGPLDRSAWDVIGNVRKRLNEGGEPVNHDLQRAVRRAYLEAAIFLCESCMKKEFGIKPGAIQSRLRKFSGLGNEEVYQIEDIHRTLKQELRKLENEVPGKDD